MNISPLTPRSEGWRCLVIVSMSLSVPAVLVVRPYLQCQVLPLGGTHCYWKWKDCKLGSTKRVEFEHKGLVLMYTPILFELIWAVRPHANCGQILMPQIVIILQLDWTYMYFFNWPIFVTWAVIDYKIKVRIRKHTDKLKTDVFFHLCSFSFKCFCTLTSRDVCLFLNLCPKSSKKVPFNHPTVMSPSRSYSLVSSC